MIVRLFRLSALGAICVALAAVLASPASAATWQWGPGTLDATHGNGACVWYTAQSACSPWNYWVTTNDYRSANSATMLCGFENNSVIRGFWSYGNGDFYCGPVNTSDVNMGGYLKAQATWWSGQTITNVFAQAQTVQG
jgi:hypothetical protein